MTVQGSVPLLHGLFACPILVVMGLCSGLLLLQGCEPRPQAQEEPTGRDPEAVFATLEDRLTGAQSVRMEFHITAEGAVDAEVSGSLRVMAGGATVLRASGEFAGQPVDLLLEAAEGSYEYGAAPDRTMAPTPPHLNEALFIGLTRMGLLHNLAMLTANAPPDGGDGGVREWVTVDSFSFAEGEAEREGADVVTFNLAVAGAPAGSASLGIDPEGRPVIRRQVVRFPDGEMRVVERYHAVSIDP
jgi:hypothetical protein